MRDKQILRIIDVNLNRVREGLRVCEETTRFILNSAPLTRELKSIRHKIQAAATRSGISREKFLGARNAGDDVGSEPSLLERKGDWQSIYFANLQRVKESLRVLEEFFKLLSNTQSTAFKRLRFQIYEFEKKVIREKKILSDCKCRGSEKLIRHSTR